MKQFSFKNLLPHIIAIAIFLIVSVIFCKPTLESGVVVQQSDVTAVESMKRQSDLYREQHGVYPLWVTSMFSGMPAYNIIYDGPVTPLIYINKVFQLGLPKPVNFFFLSCICFYILCLCVRVRPYAGIFASLAFAYAAYNPILVVAGHDTKLLAMAYAPALIGGVLLLFDKKYIPGFVLTTLFAGLQLMQNHQQITYYVFIIIGIMTLFFIARWIKEKELVHGAKAIGLAGVAAAIGILMNALLIFPVFDYAKDSKRGGQLVMDAKKDNKSNDKVENNKTTGLSRDYAFQWSNEPKEALTLMFPGVAGYGSYFSQRDGEYNIFPKLSETSHVSNYLMEKLNMPEDQASNIAANMSGRVYWGGKPFTSGPAYLGAVICFLFVLSLFVLDNKHKWWILTASLVGIAMSLGKYFPAFNNFIFDHLPFYNKFRTPEMALVIPQFLFPIAAVLAIDKLIDTDSKEAVKKLKFAAIAMGAVFVLAAGIYLTSDYSKENKQRTAAVTTAFAATDGSVNAKLQDVNSRFEAETDNRIYEELLYQSKGDAQIAKGILSAVRQDRQAFLGADIIRALVFVLLSVLLVGLLAYKKINGTIAVAGLALLVLIDLLPFDMHYINEKSVDTAEKYQQNEFSASEADKKILEDKDPNYRVFNLTVGDPFQDARTSYFHKSIGGYHPAKIGIYDDLATHQLSGQPNASVINMLNTKYIIQQGSDGKSSIAIPNPGALGNCWFVKGVKYVKGPVEEMKALDNFNPADTAVIDESFKNNITAFTPADSASSIKQVAFDNMQIKYESNSNAAHLAVFSEIFYKDWNAYIDGNKVPVTKANYVLRALVIPAGKHTIDFKFEPSVFNTSYTITMIGGWLILVLLLWFAYYSYKKSTEKK
ncbi:MAG: YfhO family protein [Ferruginibacter sp.]